MAFSKWPALLLLAFALSACGKDEPKSGETRVPYPVPPQGGEARGDKNFARLLSQYREGKPSKALWAGSWFPYAQNGTSVALSKYERASGADGAASWESSEHGAGPDVADWWGHCNGWAAASALFDEPRASVQVNGVEFGVADRKALLTEIAMEVGADFFGTRHDDPEDSSSLSYQDVFPNQFFLVLTNYVAQGITVLMDRSTGYQVWNHPIAGYRFSEVTPADYLGPHASLPGVHRVRMSAQVWWVRDDVAPDHVTEPFAFQDGLSYGGKTYQFELWLDGPPQFDPSGRMTSSGNVSLVRQGNTVSGGVWLGGGADPHPDYLWVPRRVLPSTGHSNPKLDPSWVTRNIVN